MTKRLFATVLAASIALTSVFSAPVRAADSGEIGRLLLGAGALFIITNELNKQNRNRGYVERRYVEPRYYDRDPPRRHPPRRHIKKRKWVPVACLRENRYREGPRKYFGQRCLRNNMRNAALLPNWCQTTVWGRHGAQRVYSAHCLRKNGWKFG